MIEGIVKKIMVGGIDKYAKLHNVQPEMVQIKVVNNENGTVFYKICNNFKEVESATFLQIMNKKMDLFGYESMSNPFMKKALVSYADETNDDVKNVSCFILKRNDNIQIAFYNGFKNGKITALKNLLREMGL